MKRYFTDEEQEYLGSDIERFYELWVRKESFSKAVGRGLQLPLKGGKKKEGITFFILYIKLLQYTCNITTEKNQSMIASIFPMHTNILSPW